MYEYIKGKIEEINPTAIIVDNNGIAYNLLITLNTYSRLTDKKDAVVFTHLVVREDAHILYGFSEKMEREMFRLLISVSGIGPNTARMILSSLTPKELQDVIADNNVNVLKSVKGIGLKTAQRAIVDLKDKIHKTQIGEDIFSGSNNTIKDEALSAMVMLGFPKNISEKEINKIISENKNLTVEEIIKEALKRV